MPRIFISTAEASAELHASRLTAALRRAVPDLVVDAAGSKLLEAAGANLAVDMAGRAVMGFWEAIGQLSFYKRAGEKILASLEQHKHDALVVVDAPSFHLRLAKEVRRRWPRLPILYYIAPKLWAWKEWRIKSMRQYITRTLCIFPFEVEFFGKRGVDAVYVGNPTLDQLRGVDGKSLIRRLGKKEETDPAKGIMAVFPGSRKSEVKYIWPRMVGAINILHAQFPELKPVVALAADWDEKKLAAFAPLPAGVDFIHGDSQKLLAASGVALAKSGTTTLEAALLGKPMAVCYAGAKVSYWIARFFVKLPYVSLPNILSQRIVVREFLQDDASAENLAGEIGALLTNEEYYRKMRAELLALRWALGDEPASERAAREVMAAIPALHGNKERK